MFEADTYKGSQHLWSSSVVPPQLSSACLACAHTLSQTYMYTCTQIPQPKVHISCTQIPPQTKMHKPYPHILSQTCYHVQRPQPHMHIYVLLLLSRFSRVPLCATPLTAAYQAPLSLGFSRQEHWSGLPFPSPMHESEKWKWSRSVVSNSSNPMDCSPPGSSVHGIFQAKVLEWGAIAFSIYMYTYLQIHSHMYMCPKHTHMHHIYELSTKPIYHVHRPCTYTYTEFTDVEWCASCVLPWRPYWGEDNSRIH